MPEADPAERLQRRLKRLNTTCISPSALDRPTEKQALTETLERRLWRTADQSRANAGFKVQGHSGPVLRMILPRFAQQRAMLEKASASSRRGTRVDDPACGSAVMFVSSAPFVTEQQRQPAARPSAGNRPKDHSGEPTRGLSIHGVGQTDETSRHRPMSLAVHGLEGDLRHGGPVNNCCDDPHDATGRKDFVLPNPPFNVHADH